jgi:hypothetical protein
MGLAAYGAQQMAASAVGISAVSFAVGTLVGMVVYPLVLLALEWRFSFGLNELLRQVRQGV